MKGGEESGLKKQNSVLNLKTPKGLGELPPRRGVERIDILHPLLSYWSFNTDSST